ncbi:MAG: multidrug transporter [Comamonadaceae bacterium CG1_02_60_18]|nr:MAG: multidrug transporter [Comamonadaceae bacterium CG1_02_60_18]
MAGCALIPAFERPPAPVASAWPVSANVADASATNAASATPSWQSYLTDPTLRQLVTTALHHNRDLRVATLNIEQARAQLGLRRADQFPTVNAAVSGARTPTSAGGISSTYSAGLTVTAYELDFFGRVASLKEQALAQYLATTEAAQAAQLSLMATVAQGWLALLADEELLAASTQTLATREDSLRLVALKTRYGAASDLELRLAQTLRESARVTLAQQQRQRALDENALALVLGQALPATSRAVLIAPAPLPHSSRLAALRFADLPAGLPSDLLARRPDIRAAEQALIASNANIGAARAAFFPRIALTAGVGSASTELAGLFKDGSWGWTLAPQLLLPIFDAGRNQASLDAARVGRDIAVAQYEKSIQSAFREVADALATRSTLSQQLQASTALLQAESERARLTQLRLDAGAASQLDWLDAQRSQFAAQQALVLTQLAALQNQVLLYKVLGGATPAPASLMTK